MCEGHVTYWQFVENPKATGHTTFSGLTSDVCLYGKCDAGTLLGRREGGTGQGLGKLPVESVARSSHGVRTACFPPN